MKGRSNLLHSGECSCLGLDGLVLACDFLEPVSVWEIFDIYS